MDSEIWFALMDLNGREVTVGGRSASDRAYVLRQGAYLAKLGRRCSLFVGGREAKVSTILSNLGLDWSHMHIVHVMWQKHGSPVRVYLGMVCAAVNAYGSAVTWGYRGYGGDSSAAVVCLTEGVVDISVSHGAFAAIKADGVVVAWGVRPDGGDSSAAAARLSEGVVHISA